MVTQKVDDDSERVKARRCLQGHLDSDVMDKVSIVARAIRQQCLSSPAPCCSKSSCQSAGVCVGDIERNKDCSRLPTGPLRR